MAKMWNAFCVVYCSYLMFELFRGELSAPLTATFAALFLFENAVLGVIRLLPGGSDD